MLLQELIYQKFNLKKMENVQSDFVQQFVIKRK